MAPMLSFFWPDIIATLAQITTKTESKILNNESDSLQIQVTIPSKHQRTSLENPKR